MANDFFLEVGFQQRNCHKQRICGDVFIKKRIKEENRTVVVLSDGMGHGVKANLLATLTATMAVNFTLEHKEEFRIAEIIMNTLPVCSERQMSYSTFTIVDYTPEGLVRILEYDNPQTFVLRDGKALVLNWQCLMLNSENNRGKEIKYCSFYPRVEDRIIICSDGITQSAMGQDHYPFGWGIINLQEYTVDIVRKDPTMSAAHLASRVVSIANKLDNYQPKDDSTCGVLYFRNPRRCIVLTGPPFDEKDDKTIAGRFKEFDGKKVICGATTGDIVSRELGLKITDSFDFDDPELPPISYMPGAEFLSEGILTLSKVHKLLDEFTINRRPGKGPAEMLMQLLIESDEIHFLIGTRINEAHQDPNLPIDLEIRRTVVRRIARILEDKFLKDVYLEFI